MFGFGKAQKTPVEASGLIEVKTRLVHLEMRVLGMEQAMLEMCYAMRGHLDRIDDNTKTLNRNMHRLAELSIRPPKDLLNGNEEKN